MSDKKIRGFKIDLLEHNNTWDKIDVDQCLHFFGNFDQNSCKRRSGMVTSIMILG